MNENTEDVATGTFIASWPTWLRWALFLPTSFLGSVTASVLYLSLNSLSGFFIGVNFSEGFIFQLISSAVLGGVFVYAGAWMAPSHQFAVSLFLLVLLTLITTILFLFSFSPDSSVGPIAYGIHSIVLLIAGGMVVFHFKDNSQVQG